MKQLLPTDKQLIEFNEALEKMQAPIVLPIVPNGGEAEWLAHDWTGWIVAAWWVVQKRLGLWSKQRFPFITSLFQQHEPWAQLLTDILALCIACDDAGKMPPLYRSPFEHWALCLGEIRANGVANIFGGNPDGKREYLKKCRRDLRQLRNFENPFKEQHHRTLMKAAIPLAQKTYSKTRKSGFYTQFYGPTLESYQQWLKHADSLDYLICEDNGLRVRKGQGRHSLRVQLEAVEYLTPVSLV